jgi:hypothetical protein
MDDGPLSRLFCEDDADSIDTQPPIETRCCACDEAKYEVGNIEKSFNKFPLRYTRHQTKVDGHQIEIYLMRNRIAFDVITQEIDGKEP